MEDRSLRNISSKGTAVRTSQRIFLLSHELIRTKMIDGNLQLSDVLHQTSRNLDRKAVATSLLGKEERSLENWSYDVTA